MNKEEAIKTMREGKKVTHRYFDPDEWVTLTPSGKYTFEDGVICTSFEFWRFRQGEEWEKDWELFT
jgi:hypothetical protein